MNRKNLSVEYERSLYDRILDLSPDVWMLNLSFSRAGWVKDKSSRD